MLRVLTFNVRYGSAEDGPDAWPLRRQAALDVIRGHDADLIGLQEPDADQCAAVDGALADGWQGLHGPGLDPRIDPAHGKGLWFRRARFDLLAHGVFWISETPAVAGSILEPNQWGERTGGWARLRDRTNKRELCFVCTHFDTHPGCSRRSAEIFAPETAKAAAGVPVIAVGDFNAPAGNPAWLHLTGAAGYRDAWREAGHADEDIITFNGFDPMPRHPGGDAARRAHLLRKWGTGKFSDHHVEEFARLRNERIDWILLRGSLHAKAALTDTSTRNGRCPSDHFPVLAEVDWRPSS